MQDYYVDKHNYIEKLLTVYLANTSNFYSNVNFRSTSIPYSNNIELLNI